ncbi:CBO0543 family protein [Cytobacillus depressus]|uniref:CBO0543 family protein n=1 Tax=Cytobacillus depressus TaxID=1602942 RepID=UPI001FEA0F0F|nr:CBO0543 family protein [Cytobacillus depressus]
MNAIYALVWLFALYKWGDYKNWRKYYPTILFYILGNFIYLYLLSETYPMWRYNPQGINEDIGLTNAHISFSIMIIQYPATILIYLSRFPERKWKNQLLFVIGWVLLYALQEFIDIKFNFMDYYNGWNFYWSILFNFVMFIILRIHHTRPLLAWLLSFLFIIFLWNVFDVPKEAFK